MLERSLAGADVSAWLADAPVSLPRCALWNKAESGVGRQTSERKVVDSRLTEGNFRELGVPRKLGGG